MKEELIVVPAYGRDYKSAKEAATAWLRGDDFQISDVSSRYNGRYCSCRDPIIPHIRFNERRQVVTVR
jgi:hypothetical protein